MRLSLQLGLHGSLQYRKHTAKPDQTNSFGTWLLVKHYLNSEHHWKRSSLGHFLILTMQIITFFNWSTKSALFLSWNRKIWNKFRTFSECKSLFIVQSTKRDKIWNKFRTFSGFEHLETENTAKMHNFWTKTPDIQNSKV